MRGLGPALTPPIKVSSPPVTPGGLFVQRCRRIPAGTCALAKYGLITHCAARPDADALH